MLVALAATALTMAALFVLVAAFAGENVAGDEAGRFWALLFAGALAPVRACSWRLLGLVLLGRRRSARARRHRRAGGRRAL